MKQIKKSIYIFPNTEAQYKKGSNDYIKNLIFNLNSNFNIVNKETKIGLLDILLKINKCDFIYFNWVEDIPDRRFGYLQVPILAFILLISKILRVKIIWFIHNNLSHNKKNLQFKKFIRWLMKIFSDILLSHSTEIKPHVDKNKFFSFPHPVENYHPLILNKPYEYDLLIWGTVSPYKGISELVEYVAKKNDFKDFKILIAGKFESASYYDYIKNIKPTNIFIENKLLTEEELTNLFSTCRYVLFTYNSSSVLSSAALCKTISFGKEVIGPRIGAFKELGSKNLIYNYVSFHALALLLNNLKNKKIPAIDKTSLINYVENTSWKAFTNFLISVVN